MGREVFSVVPPVVPGTELGFQLQGLESQLCPSLTNWVNPLFSLGLGFLISKVAIKNHPHLPFRAVVRIQSSYKVTNAYGMQLVLNKSQPVLLSLTNC